MASNDDAQRRKRIWDMRKSGSRTDGEIAELEGVSRTTVLKWGAGARDGDPNRFRHAGHPARGGGRGIPTEPAHTRHPAARGAEPPLPRSDAGEPELPASVHRPLVMLQIDYEGWAAVFNDAHHPYHDEKALRSAVGAARDADVKVVLINGDWMDMRGVSPFYREPDEMALVGEIEGGRQQMRWLRWHFPHARIVFREGNHEFRLRRFIADRAKELFGLPGTTLPELLDLKALGIEWVQDKRLVRLGKLNTLHGHELSKGGGVNPARYAFLKATDTVMVGHWHQTSNHTQRTLSGKQITTWSVGCLCSLQMDYAPYSAQANHGFALVRCDADGEFEVRNHRIRDGRVE